MAIEPQNDTDLEFDSWAEKTGSNGCEVENELKAKAGITCTGNLTTTGTINGSRKVVGTTAGSANTQTLTPTPALGAYAQGNEAMVKAGFSNSSALTLNVSGLGARSVKSQTGDDLKSGEWIAGRTYHLIDDGTNWVLINHAGFWAKSSQSSALLNADPSSSAGTAFSTDLTVSITVAGRAFIECLGFANLNSNTEDRAAGVGITKDSTTGKSTNMDFVHWSTFKEDEYVNNVKTDGNARTAQAYGYVTVAAGTHVFRLTSHCEGSNSVHSSLRSLVVKVHPLSVEI